MSIPATAYVLTLNSAATLPACLESLWDFDDILVVDGNSTDGTREIAKRFGARVIAQTDDATPNKRIENFTAVRERAFASAHYDWIFQLDSDEVATPEVIEYVREAVIGNDPSKAAKFQRLAIVEGRVIRHAYFFPEYCLRLIHRRSGISWNQKRAVHERLMIPENVVIITGHGEILQTWPPLAECRTKDRRYLDLSIRPLTDPTVPVGKIIRASAVNVAKGISVLIHVLTLTLAHRPDTLPLRYHLRFPMYHFSFAARLAHLAILKVAKPTSRYLL